MPICLLRLTKFLICACFCAALVPGAANAADPKLLTISRLSSSAASDWVLSTSATDIAAKKAVGYVVNATNAGGVFDQQVPGTVPIWCLTHAARSVHLYTTDPWDRALAKSLAGFVDDTTCGSGVTAVGASSVLGYAFREKTPYTTALQQTYKPSAVGKPIASTISMQSTNPMEIAYTQYYGWALWGTGPATPYGKKAPGGTIAYTVAPGSPYYDVGYPSGTYAGKAPRGTMVVIHGGGWYATVGLAVSMRSRAAEWNARGWQTINISYPSLKGSMPSVNTTYAAIRKWVGPAATTCTTGDSAGGHLSLWLAMKNPDISCVISKSGPADLNAMWAGNYVMPTLTYTFCPGIVLADTGLQPCQDLLRANSPTTFAQQTHARVLVGAVSSDFVVPASQVTAYVAARGGVGDTRSVILAPGTVPWVHAKASQASVDQFTATEISLSDAALANP